VTRVVVFGSLGMLGQDVVATAPAGFHLTAFDKDCDVTDPAAVERVLREVAAEVVINCAAYTAVDRAEQEPDTVRRINADAPGIIGRAAAGAGAFVVHYSTDYVFDGSGTHPYREDDAPAPRGVYARTKLEGERSLATSGARHVILRTSWLFGAHGKSFPRTMWERAAAGQATRVVNDQRGRPTYTVDLATATWALVTKHRSPLGVGAHVLHVANAGIATWYDVARRVFEAAGRADRLAPCTTAEYPTPAPRPAYSVLDTSRYDALAGSPLPSWQDALDRFVQAIDEEPSTVKHDA
jgi:dTDP-4-dehydrorhamnose reductase